MKRNNETSVINKSKRSRPGIYACKKIFVRNDDDPHVYTDFPAEYAKIGKNIYRVSKNNESWDKMINSETGNYIGLTMAQYDDLRGYIFDKKIMISNFTEHTEFAESILLTLHNDSSFRAVLSKKELTNHISNKWNRHIFSIDQTININYNDLKLYASVDEINGNVRGMIGPKTNIDFNFTQNIIIHDSCVNISSKFVKITLDNCVMLKNNIAMDIDNEINSDKLQKFPLLINRSVLNRYVRSAIGDNFMDNTSYTYSFGSFEYYFTVKIVDVNKQTRYQNTYKLVDDDTLDIRSNTKNVIITESSLTAAKISFSCTAVAQQKYDSRDYLISVEEVDKYLRDNIKFFTKNQTFRYTNVNKKEFLLGIKNVEPRSFDVVKYKIEPTTEIVFKNDKKSNFIFVKNTDSKDIKKIVFRVKKLGDSTSVIMALLGGGGEDEKQILIDSAKLEKDIRNFFPKKTTVNHKSHLTHKGENFHIKVKEIVFQDTEIKTGEKIREKYPLLGLITPETEIKFVCGKNDKSLSINYISSQVDNPVGELEKYVGGVNKEIKKVVRTLCLARGKLRDEFLARGLKPVKGIVMYGPPGTGKTSICRQIGKIFGCEGDRLRLMSGPEVFNKWVGKSEENVRAIFKPAKEAWKKHGSNSPLYMVVIDEIDALLPARSGSSGNPVRDSVVNQFLAEMDGLQEFNNFVCIGLTNKLELLDPAVIRPGRFGIHIKIDLPDKKGRVEIFNIHTRKLRELNRLENIDFDKLADLTETFSGADIEGVTELASTYSLERLNTMADINDAIILQKGRITQEDFVRAINEIRKDHNKSDDRGKAASMYI